MSESIKEQLQLALDELDEAMTTQGYENINEIIMGAQERIETAIKQTDALEKTIDLLMDAVALLAGVDAEVEADLRRRVKENEGG